MYPILKDGIELHKRPDMGALLSENAETKAVVNRFGEEILELCDGKHSVEEISNVIANRYEGDYNKIKGMISNFLIESEKRGYIKFIKRKSTKGIVTSGNMEYHIPFTAMIELTRNCNLNCRHCYVKSYKQIEELPLNEMKNVLDKLSKAGTKAIQFTGGQSLLYPWFFELLKYSAQKFSSIVVSTNGWLVNEEIADKFSKYHVKVKISIDGMEKTHDYFRGVKGSFKRVKNAIQVLSEKTFQ